MELPEIINELTPEARILWVVVLLILIIALPQLLILLLLVGGIVWCLHYLINNGPDGPRTH